MTTVAEPTTPTRIGEPLGPDQIGAITALMLEGRRVSEVIAHGLSRRPGWRRQHVTDLIAERGWTLDSDGRVPLRHRTSTITPVTALPGAPAPTPPRAPVVEYPRGGTVTEGRGANEAAGLIAQGLASDITAVVRAAEKAKNALGELRRLLKEDEENAVLRNRLAQIEAEAARLRAQLGVKKRRPTSTSRTSPERTTSGGRGGNLPASEATRAKPIDHGTWGGYLQHSKRDVPIPADDACGCNAAKDRQIAKLHGKA